MCSIELKCLPLELIAAGVAFLVLLVVGAVDVYFKAVSYSRRKYRWANNDLISKYSKLHLFRATTANHANRTYPINYVYALGEWMAVELRAMSS